MGVAGRLTNELHHHIEALEGVVDQDVLFPDRREAVAPVVEDAFGEAGGERLELQVRTIWRDQLRQLVQAQQAVDQQDIVGLGAEIFADEAAQALGHGLLDLDPDHRAQSPLLQAGLELTDQILGLFLDLHVGVADQAEHPAGLHIAPGKQVIDEQGDHALERDGAPLRLGRLAPAAGGFELPEPRHLGGNRHQGVELAPIGIPAKRQG